MHSNDDMIRRYLKDISKYPLLTADREKRLSKIILDNKSRSKVIKARNEMIEGNLRAVVKLASELYSKISGGKDINVSVMDLIQAGNLGLIRAAELFSYKRNLKFSTYAYPSIIRKMHKTLLLSHFVRLPFNHFRHIAGLKDMENRLGDKNITDKQIKDELKITSFMFSLIKNEKRPKINIEAIEGGMETITDENEIPQNEKVASRYLKHYLYEKMKELKPFHRDVLFYRFFGDEEFTAKKIADKYGVSREMVRVTIRDALRKLRAKMEDDLTAHHLKLKNPMKDI